MRDKIVHFGVDEHYRLRTLREAGYTVESCVSLSEFKWVLYSEGLVDLIVFTEADGIAPYSAISLARNKCSPLVLFQGWMPHYEQSPFNLVIPMLASVDQWLGEIAHLIESTQRLIEESSNQRTKSRILCEEIARLKEQTIFEFRRSEIELQRNRRFKIEFLPPEGDSSGLDDVSGSGGFLGSLSKEEIQGFRSLMSRSSYEAGTVLFREGQLGGRIYLVYSGSVKLSLNSSDRKRFILHIAGPGEIIGLPSAFTSCPHMVTAEACYPCELGSVSSADFLNFLDRHPHTLRAAACLLGRAYNQASARLRTMGVGFTVMAKVAGLLLEWSGNGNETGRGKQIHVALTHGEMGQCIGATRESVSRILNDLQHRQIIDQKGSMVTILDRVALETCAGER
jgi:CRP/FNR family transcriptional regulator, cyclic AMP receptor protein